MWCIIHLGFFANSKTTSCFLVQLTQLWLGLIFAWSWSTNPPQRLLIFIGMWRKQFLWSHPEVGIAHSTLWLFPLLTPAFSDLWVDLNCQDGFGGIILCNEPSQSLAGLLQITLAEWFIWSKGALFAELNDKFLEVWSWGCNLFCLSENARSSHTKSINFEVQFYHHTLCAFVLLNILDPSLCDLKTTCI